MSVELIKQLQLGRVPRVVGTIITVDFLRAWSANPRVLDCDLVELRVDGFPDFAGWIQIGQEIERMGLPVFATVRLSAQGGQWTRPDSERWPLLESAITNLSGVDVEIQSELVEKVCSRCQELGKLSVLSHHDFQFTPSLEEMRRLIQASEKIGGSIAKIAAAANTTADVENLRTLVRESWNVPICIIGMGPLGRETRLTFPLEGSCFTYGYLDTPGAPGQFSAAELMAHFKAPRLSTR